MAESEPETYAVFGHVTHEGIVSFVIFTVAIDNIWEVDLVQTRFDQLRRGFGKAVLADASACMLEKGSVLLHTTGADHVASIRTAQAVGYREAYRVAGYEGKARPS